MFPKLNFPDFNFKFKVTNQKKQIFDVFRKKFVFLTPEEWVRQNLLMYLCEYKNFPESLLEVEKKVLINGMNKRCDALFYNQKMDPLMIVECKSPEIKITDKVFNQIARYYLVLKPKFLLISNGMIHYFFSIDNMKKKYLFHQNIPDYNKIT